MVEEDDEEDVYMENDEEMVIKQKETREERFKKRHGDTSEHVALGEEMKESPKPKAKQVQKQQIRQTRGGSSAKKSFPSDKKGGFSSGKKFKKNDESEEDDYEDESDEVKEIFEAKQRKPIIK